MASWRDARVATEARLRDGRVERPDQEARWMLERVSGYDGAEFVVAEHEDATEPALATLDAMVGRRLGGEPLQYVLGVWQFLGVELLVDPRVLIPRPETELVAQCALEEAERLGLRRGGGDVWSGTVTADVVVDLGTGSGALALALATELPDAEVWAIDTSEDALRVARANVAGVGGSAATRIRVAQGSWFDALPAELRGEVHVVVSNPPYIAEHEVAELPRSVIDWEPYGALVSGPTGLEAIEAVVAGAAEWLDPDGGVLICELAPHQSDAAAELARAAGFAEVSVQRDLTDRNRVVIARTATSDTSAR
jgi:release factor glutamine methyltransferase